MTMAPSDPIRVREYGKNGPRVIVLHGGPGARGEMAPVAGRLGRRFRVLEPLQRSSGEVPLTVARHVADLHEVLQAPLGEGPVGLVGFSWGAMLALTYAARHPEGIDRVVLIGCGTFDVRARDIYQSRMSERTTADLRRHIRQLDSQLAAETDPARRNDLFAGLGALYACVQSYRPLATDPEQALPCDEAGFRETWADALALQDRGVQPAEFARIAAPVAMIHGSDDPHPGRLIHASLAPIIGRLEYREVPRCGHKPWTESEAREPFYAMLADCLGRA
jgi:pimeloyl-ACP methyl ester carboxylesterase